MTFRRGDASWAEIPRVTQGARSVPEITGVLETALYVADVARSVEFYTSLFGFAVIDRDERLTALGVRPGQLLLLCAKQGSIALPRTSHFGQGKQHVAFAVPREALGDWEKRLEGMGIPIVERRKWPRGGESLYFRDPDEHLLELATPGVWSIY
jgi:catechol 2,3-dioxygenase-like lactoylglutathione lyase family enzyme